jgi:hypothetical protein
LDPPAEKGVFKPNAGCFYRLLLTQNARIDHGEQGFPYSTGALGNQLGCSIRLQVHTALLNDSH